MAEISEKAAELLNTYNRTQSLWEYLSLTEKPIIMYGMGDGAVKIMNVFTRYGIKPAEFIASDEFVRGHDFLGYRVKKLSDVQALYDDFIIIICFGSALTDVTDRIYALAEKYEVYAPDVPVVGDGLFDTEYLKENAEKIFTVRSMLADEYSMEVFDKLINYRLSGKPSFLRSAESAEAEAFGLLNIGKDETYVDLGAYTGDTAEKFLSLCGREFRKIYAFEPDSRSFSKLRRRLYMLTPEQLEAHNAIAWNEDCELDFVQKAGRSSAITGKGRIVKTQARSVDSVLNGEKATLIKLDVEGCEKQALIGATKTIGKYRPKLILSLYHRNEDYFELPLLVHKLNPHYKMYLRHHPYVPAWDTNLYCI